MERNVIKIFTILYSMLFVHSIGVDLETPKVSFIPNNYLLQIITSEAHFKDGNTSAMMFDGVVTVDFDMKVPENFNDDFQIALNINPKMVIQTTTLKGKKLESYDIIESCKIGPEKDKHFINCTKTVQYRTFQLKVEYKSPFGNDMTGFYRSSYKDASNNTRWLLTTHFEPIYARNAFPCFDQPDLKAKFIIQITVPKDIKTVLSNTKLDKLTEEGNLQTFSFKQTEIPMSTYLVAFTASNLLKTESEEFKSDYLKEKFPKRELTTYGREEIIKKGDGALAQKIGIQAINLLTTYLGLGYAFEKIDQVGIPDFSAGAMENWGHISFREKSLFFNEKTGSAITKQSNILTITHELVHQWFGNLVTLKSWDYIWLNEAFANYLEYKISSNFEDYKKWNLMDQFLVNEIHLRAFETDGLNSSKSLNNKITDESLIFSSFNDIPYSKGAAVLRMWDYEFKDKFQESLQDYLKERKENTCEPSQLFEAFKKKANMKNETFQTWTEQAGYPVVEVQKKNTTYVLSQSRFFWEKIKSEEIWDIPITFSTSNSPSNETSSSLWLYKSPVKIDIKENCKWIIVNNKQAGYYRVSYEKENWEALTKALLEKNHSDIHELNRAQIVNDIFSLARSLQKNYVDYATAFSLAKYLKNDNSLIVWKTALNSFDFLKTKVYKEIIYDKFKIFVLSLIKPHFKNLNPDGLEHLEKLKNVEISRWACSIDFEPCVEQAKTLFKNNSYANFTDTQEIVLCTVVRNDEKVWDSIFNKYKSEEDSALKIMYISALGCTNSETQAEAFLNKTLESNSDIRKQDLIYVLSSVYNGNPKNIETAFKFIKENYKKIHSHYGGINPLGKALVGIAKKLATKEQVKNLIDLADEIKKSPEGKAAEDSIESAKKIASGNAEWVEEKMSQLRIYFNSGFFMSYSFTLLLLCLIFVFQF